MSDISIGELIPMVVHDAVLQLRNMTGGDATVLSLLVTEYLIYSAFKMAPMETLDWLKHIPRQCNDVSKPLDALTEARAELRDILEMQVSKHV